jgi:U4/U6 small nuclear ribonucleoprotein PRP4
MDRRDRLREYLSLHPEFMDILDQAQSESENEEIEEEFYTYGLPELLETRRKIFDFSLQKAQERIFEQKQEYAFDLTKRKKMRHEWYSYCKVNFYIFLYMYI